MENGKIFLSHSSFDKPYVAYIAEFFGKDRCIYDEMCFEAGMKNLEEILHYLQRTGIFVCFISEHSLESDWVKRELFELNLLNGKGGQLSQIFPIIIDESIQHSDPRIPEFMRKGYDSYNLRYIKSNRIACKKIQAQYLKQIFDLNPNKKSAYFLFYGRDQEIRSLKTGYDSGQPIKCIVASGIEGIGRKSYITRALHDMGIFPEYYIPFTISMNQDDQIEDIIVKLSDLGFSDYTLTQVTKMSSVDEKINVLASIFEEIQNQHEHVLIYDHLSIIPFSREPKYWFTKALEKVRPEITISLLSTAELKYSYLRSHEEYFSVTIKELPYPEWNGLLRIYSKQINIPFETDDRAYFKDILTGYPPQVIACADFAREYGIQYVKDNAQQVIKMVSDKVVDLMSVAFTKENSQEGYKLLAFLSQYGTMPMKVVYDIVNIHPVYESILARLKALTICRLVGQGEYLEVSPLVADYVQRNNFQISDSIRTYLRSQMNSFYENMKAYEKEDFESLKFFLKEALMEGKEIPQGFLYATLYLMSVRELYDKNNYKRVMEIMDILKSNGSFSRFDGSVQEQLQQYYCRALARETDDKFYTEVEWFKTQEPFNDIEYNFLRGFMFRQIGEFGKAIERYNKILEKRGTHRRALRELVSAYRGMEDYENFGDYAEMNYHTDPENLYNIQPYFEVLLQKVTKSPDELLKLDQMLSTITKHHNITPTSVYYELNALHAMYIEKDQARALQFLREGNASFPNSPYILRTYFDCYEMDKNRIGMEEILGLLKKRAKNNRASNISYQRREIIYQAYNGKSLSVLMIQIRRLTMLTEAAQNKLVKHVKKIVDTRNL
jgi:TIR protein